MAGCTGLRAKQTALFLTAALAFISHAFAGTNPRFTTFPTTRKIGESWTVECVMDDLERYVDALNIKKLVAGTNNPHVVGTNGVLNTEFTSSGRFNASYSLSPEKQATFRLTINPIKGEDEGDYFCGQSKQKKTLDVEEVVTSVKMTRILSSASGSNNTANAASVTTTEAQNWKLRLAQDPQITCLVTIDSLVRNVKPADLRVTITSGTRDITSQFEDNAIFTVKDKDTGLQSYQYEITKKSTASAEGAKGFVPTVEDNDQELACTAEMKSGTNSDKVLLTVLYPPTLECKNGYAEAEAEGRVTCKVHGNPLPRDIVWTVGDKTLKNGDTLEDYKVEQRTDGKFGYETTLIVGTAKAQHFDEKFNVKAVNDLGSVTSDPVYLKKGTAPPAGESNSLAASTFVSLVTFALMVTLAMLLH